MSPASSLLFLSVSLPAPFAIARSRSSYSFLSFLFIIGSDSFYRFVVPVIIPLPSSSVPALVSSGPQRVSFQVVVAVVLPLDCQCRP